MRVRLGTDADIPSIERIVKSVIPLMQAVGNMQWDERYPLRDDFATDVIRSNLWVAVDDEDNVAGFAALTKDVCDEYADAGCDLSIPAVVPHRMAVDTAYRGQGVAQLLFIRAEELARELGYTLVRVDTNSFNVPMCSLIVKAGYTFKGEVLLPGKGAMVFNCYEKDVSQ